MALLHRRTDGNPLFLVSLVDFLLAQGQLTEVDGRWVLRAPVEDLAVDAPATLSQMVERQIERLTPEQQTLLTVAAVAGVEFSTALAAAEGIDEEEAERRCDGLARRGQFLRSAGTVEWPDGTVAARYAFIHALYQHVLYARIPAGHRVQLHLSTGERLEQAHGPRTGEIAGELAMHFTQGRDFGRAVRYHQQAGAHALGRHGYREAADHLTRALQLLESLPDTPARREEELALRVRLGSALLAIEGHAAPAVERAYARARQLCDQVSDSPRLLPVLRSLGRFYLVRGSLDAARDVGRRLEAMAGSTHDAATLRAAHDLLGHVSFYTGELPTALAHLDRAIELRDPGASAARASSALRLVLDAGVSCTAHAAWALWMLGYPARAEARMREALALAQASAHPFSLAHAHRFAAALHQVRRERDRVRDQVEACAAISAPHVSAGAASPYYGFGAVALAASFHRGWLLVEGGRHEDGLASMREWVRTCRETGSQCLLPAYLASLAETCGQTGRRGEGLDLVNEALAVASGSGIDYWTAELHRLRGELVDGEHDAAACFLEALAVARRQQARSFELRAAMSLSRLRARQGRTREARARLADVHAWFTDGFDTADLEDARVLLETLERPRSR